MRTEAAAAWQVLERGHTLILGWSDKLLPIVKQLAISRAASGGGTVVILAERDKEEMDAEASPAPALQPPPVSLLAGLIAC